MDYFFFTILLTLLSLIYLKLARKFNIIDKPNHRSSHNTPTIRGGGILFLFAILIYWFFSDFEYPYFVVGTLIVATLSFIDDVKSLGVKIRLPIQVLALLLLFYQIGFCFFPIWSYLPVLIIGIGFINLFNFLDGINGITGFSSIVTLGAFYFINQSYSVVENSFLIILLISIALFGFFNFRKKAIMFAGDIGSISMGMVILFLGIKYLIATGSPIVVCFYMVFGCDSTLTLLYRIYNNERIFDPHRNHIYQKLVDNFGLSHISVSFFYSILQLIIIFPSVFVMYNFNPIYQYFFCIGIAGILIMIYMFIFKINERKVKLSKYNI